MYVCTVCTVCIYEAGENVSTCLGMCIGMVSLYIL